MSTREPPPEDFDDPAKVRQVYLLLLWVWCWMQFGHGSNMGVATTIGGKDGVGNGEAMALSSWVCIGACFGLPFVSPLLRDSKRDRMLVCVLGPVIIASIALMLVPRASLKFLYFARFCVGFAEAPILPWITDWLNAYSNNWTLENTIVHAICPVAETMGFVLSQELQEAGVPWQSLFVAQMTMVAIGLAALQLVGGHRYLSRSGECPKEVTKDLKSATELQPLAAPASSSRGAALPAELDELEPQTSAASFAERPHWMLFWCINLGLAAALFSACGIKFCVKAFTRDNFGMNVHQLVGVYFIVSLIGPGGGAALTTVLLSDRVKPEDFRLHRTTLRYMSICAILGASFGLFTVWVATRHFGASLREAFFMLGLLVSMFFGAAAFPAAQALINNSLGRSYVLCASSMQTLTTNMIANVPGPWVIGTLIDQKGATVAFLVGMCGNVVAAVLLTLGLVTAEVNNLMSSSARGSALESSQRGGGKILRLL
eukprot:TRINITY_DN22464_c0_g2_i1.p1 TRINITY_DN22464_c0_g2~~TRINITY_DN22464_c0_g2_i1.p1  ORF type:complete len:487 (+),score=114.42 TRINITY_DN22464_c0_g2_i1:157-1617(+)